MISAQCPHCKKTIKAPEAALGKRGKCGHCQKSFTVEAAADTPKKPATPPAKSPDKAKAAPAKGKAPAAKPTPSAKADKNAKPTAKPPATPTAKTPAKPASKPLPPDKIRVHCPKCKSPMVVPKQFVGKKGKCGKCEHAFRIADESGPASPKPQPAPAKPAAKSPTAVSKPTAKTKAPEEPKTKPTSKAPPPPPAVEVDDPFAEIGDPFGGGDPFAEPAGQPAGGEIGGDPFGFMDDSAPMADPSDEPTDVPGRQTPIAEAPLEAEEPVAPSAAEVVADEGSVFDMPIDDAPAFSMSSILGKPSEPAPAAAAKPEQPVAIGADPFAPNPGSAPTGPPALIRVHCPTCDAVMDVPGAFIGKKGKCEACQTVFRVPATGYEIVEAAAPAPTAPAPAASGGDDPFGTGVDPIGPAIGGDFFGGDLLAGSKPPPKPLKIRTFCPSCNAAMDVPGEFIGKKGKCDACQTVFRVPATGYEVLEAAPSEPTAPAPAASSGDDPFGTGVDPIGPAIGGDFFGGDLLAGSKPPPKPLKIRTHCPSCNAAMDVPGEFIGKKGKCDACQHVFRIPEEGYEILEAAPAEAEAPVSAGGFGSGDPFATAAAGGDFFGGGSSTPELIRIACPSCQAAIEVPGQFIGKKGQCDACKTVFRVPTEGYETVDMVARAAEEAARKAAEAAAEAEDIMGDRSFPEPAPAAVGSMSFVFKEPERPAGGGIMGQSFGDMFGGGAGATKGVKPIKIRISCPECEATMDLAAKFIGKKGQCNNCHTVFRVPDVGYQILEPAIKTDDDVLSAPSESATGSMSFIFKAGHSSSERDPFAQPRLDDMDEPAAIKAVTIRIGCPECLAKITVPAKFIGKKGRCDNCLHVFTVPDVGYEIIENIQIEKPKPVESDDDILSAPAEAMTSSMSFVMRAEDIGGGDLSLDEGFFQSTVPDPFEGAADALADDPLSGEDGDRSDDEFAEAEDLFGILSDAPKPDPYGAQANNEENFDYRAHRGGPESIDPFAAAEEGELDDPLQTPEDDPLAGGDEETVDPFGVSEAPAASNPYASMADDDDKNFDYRAHHGKSLGVDPFAAEEGEFDDPLETPEDDPLAAGDDDESMDPFGVSADAGAPDPYGVQADSEENFDYRAHRGGPDSIDPFAAAEEGELDDPLALPEGDPLLADDDDPFGVGSAPAAPNRFSSTEDDDDKNFNYSAYRGGPASVDPFAEPEESSDDPFGEGADEYPSQQFGPADDTFSVDDDIDAASALTAADDDDDPFGPLKGGSTFAFRRDLESNQPNSPYENLGAGSSYMSAMQDISATPYPPTDEGYEPTAHAPGYGGGMGPNDPYGQYGTSPNAAFGPYDLTGNLPDDAAPMYEPYAAAMAPQYAAQHSPTATETPYAASFGVRPLVEELGDAFQAAVQDAGGANPSMPGPMTFSQLLTPATDPSVAPGLGFAHSQPPQTAHPGEQQMNQPAAPVPVARMLSGSLEAGSFVVQCPSCSVSITIEAKYMGRRGLCKTCKTVFRAPQLVQEAAPPPPPPAPVADPFGASDDPFGGGDAGGDPFGGGDGGGDPFGGEAPPAAVEEDPFGGAAVGDDPFASPPESADPFSNDDPFGGGGDDALGGPDPFDQPADEDDPFHQSPAAHSPQIDANDNILGGGDDESDDIFAENSEDEVDSILPTPSRSPAPAPARPSAFGNGGEIARGTGSSAYPGQGVLGQNTRPQQSPAAIPAIQSSTVATPAVRPVAPAIPKPVAPLPVTPGAPVDRAAGHFREIKIEAVEAFSVRLPAKVDAGGKPTTISRLLIRVAGSNGVAGWAETAPCSVSGAASRASVLTSIRQSAAPALRGMNAWNVRKTTFALDQALPSPFARDRMAVKAAIDAAIYDLLARSLEVPLYAFVGGRLTHEVTFNEIIHAGTPEQAAAQAQAANKNGALAIKLVIGTAGEWNDRRIVQATAEALAGRAFLSVDAQNAYDLPTAIRLAQFLARLGIQSLQRPLRNGRASGHARLTALNCIPIGVDEPLVTTADLFEHLRAAAVDIPIVNVQKLGGWTNARSFVALAESAGLRVMGGGDPMSDLGLAHQAHWLGSFGVDLPSDGNGRALLDSPYCQQTLVVQQGRVKLPDGPGTGIVVDEDMIRRTAVETA